MFLALKCIVLHGAKAFSSVHLKMSHHELACVYAALILQDDDIAVTDEKIATILKAARVEVEPFWPSLFAKALLGIDIKALITNISSGVGSGQAAPAGEPSVVGGTAPAAETAPAKEEKKEEPKEESDDDMGFGLFD